MIIAQSLGCQVLANYLWDAEHDNNIFKPPKKKSPSGSQSAKAKRERKQKDDFRRLKNLKHLITTGCNIPLFTAGLDDRRCFSKPSDDFQWDNYYDPDDVLGWPLRQLDMKKRTFEIVNDHPINAGSPLTSWNPLSHTSYWTDSDVLDPLERSLRKFL